jgi:UPF0755 protein
VRILIRLITLVLTLSAVVFIITGAFWYIWQDARAKTPAEGTTITVKMGERAALGLYLQARAAEVARAANPADAGEVVFVVKSGETVQTVAANLQRLKLISDAKLFGWIVRYWGADGDIQAGVYSLRPNMTMEEIMGELRHGRMAATTVTIREGWRAEEIAALLEQVNVVPAAEFLDAVNRGELNYAFLAAREPGSPASLEGFLFPDTYQFPQKTTARRVLEIMLQNWDARVPEELRAKAKEQGLTLYEVVTLAAIVEREAVVAEERPVIASVYLNRLRKGMYLQADPTVQYAKGYDANTKKWWNPMVQEEAFSVKSPYNTFLQAGLPPTPICNPGAGAIKGVLQPENTPYLYFYAKGDGSHAFATTYEDHLKNQEQYGRKKR